MSIFSLKGSNLQLCKRAFLLVNGKQRPVLYLGHGVLRCLAHNNSFRTEERRPRVSYNTEVLRAANCNESRKTLDQRNSAKGPEIKTSGKSGGDHSKKTSNGNDWSTKLLLGLAAALGIGATTYFFMKDKTKDKDTDDNTEKIKTIETKPHSSQNLPKHVPYLIIGGGTAAFSAFRAIKSNDARAKVLIITEENRNPYMRPPLSKELWYSAKDTQLTNDYRFKQWTGAERSLYFEPEEFFVEPEKLIDNEKGGIAVAQGFRVKKIDPSKHVVTLSDDYEIRYDECLIATGCTPKLLPVFENTAPGIRDKVMVYRTPNDFERLKSYVDRKKNVVIIGNGFIGSELACSLANYTKENGSQIYQIFPENGNMSKVLPDYLSRWTMKKMQSQGIRIFPNSSIKNVTRDKSSIELALSTGETIISDIVVVCVGCEANTELASLSGLEVDSKLGGFVVNAELEARRNLFVAGDASCFFDPLLGRRRVEHHDHSVVSGRLAGENMVGKKKPYTHQSMFWSDLGPEIGYEGIGLVDSSLPTVGVFALPSKDEQRSDNLAENINNNPEKTDVEVKTIKSADKSKGNVDLSKSADKPLDNNDDSFDYGRGVVFYLKGEKIVGILLWNIFNRVGLARTIINQNKKYEDLNEVAKLFEIHS